MNKFNKFVIKFARFLQALLIVALGLLGIILIILLFRDLIPIFQALVSPSIKKSNVNIMDEIIVFFLFFEFTSMIIAALRHHGHTSINFLMGLGVTALVRSLITAHGQIEEIIGTSVSILVIIIAMVIFNKNMKNM